MSSAFYLATCALAFGLLGNAQADSGRAMPRNVPSAYTQECGACHTAYPPSLLPARSWQRTMEGLDKHFGTDAALDSATTQQLNAWLQAHAGTARLYGTGRGASPAARHHLTATPRTAGPRRE